mmetsp:Transcript_1357/g.3101  ORF Transcript_1357/g.3101 Transcript_1357/m.3101 type:complete len:326 (-) Transcript_1357:364-1341(-)
MQFNKIDISVIKDPLLLNQQPSLWSLICCKLRDTTWFWPAQHGWPPRDNRYSPKAVFQETGLQYQGSMGSCRTASTLINPKPRASSGNPGLQHHWGSQSPSASRLTASSPAARTMRVLQALLLLLQLCSEGLTISQARVHEGAIKVLRVHIVFDCLPEPLDGLVQLDQVTLLQQRLRAEIFKSHRAMTTLLKHLLESSCLSLHHRPASSRWSSFRYRSWCLDTASFGMLWRFWRPVAIREIKQCFAASASASALWHCGSTGLRTSSMSCREVLGEDLPLLLRRFLPRCLGARRLCWAKFALALEHTSLFRLGPGSRFACLRGCLG